MSNLSHNKTIIVTILGSLGFLAGCSSPTIGDGGIGGSGPIGIGGETGSGGASTGGAAAGGAFSTGGASCGTTKSPPKTVLCAGDYYESEELGTAKANISTMFADTSCLVHPFYYYPGEPGYPSTGGSSGWIPEGPGGSSSAPDDVGMGGAIDEPVGTGGYAVGGFFGTGGVDVGGSFGTGGIAAGGSGSGGGIVFGGDGTTLSDWCDSVEPTSTIAGVSFASGACQDSDLKLPVTFSEPYGFYRLRVFGGSTACERGTLLTEMEGFGTGALVSLPFAATEGFISLEFTSASYASLNLQLNALVVPTTLPKD